MTEYEVEDDLKTFNQTVNPKGVLQISYYYIEDSGSEKDEIVMDHLNRFINKFEINIDINSKMILETSYSTHVLTAGIVT